MRLTTSIRERLVRSIMADVPTTDFAALGREEVLAATVAALPPAVRKVWDNSETREFIKLSYVHTDCGGISATVPGSDRYGSSSVPTAAMTAFRARCGELRAENERLSGLRQVLKANLATVTTRKALVERFPDFAAYLPEPAATANLPATTDLTDRLKAAGWAAPAKEDA